MTPETSQWMLLLNDGLSYEVRISTDKHRVASNMCSIVARSNADIRFWNIPRYQPFLTERYLLGEEPIAFLKTREK